MRRPWCYHASMCNLLGPWPVELDLGRPKWAGNAKKLTTVVGPDYRGVIRGFQPEELDLDRPERGRQ